MGFLGIYTALYDYQPQGENELEIQEGELLFLLDKGEDDWWKAKKKAADDEDEEPVGLVPANYLEEVGSTTLSTPDLVTSDTGMRLSFRLCLFPYRINH
jgi:actin cytoskeleton-regulatory complex protein SLA1